jgi:hypothetical protein
MTQAIQVNFRRLLPSEELVTLANERYRNLRKARPEIEECSVSLEGLEPATTRLVQATITLHQQHKEIASARAVHRSPAIAFNLALAQIQVRLGVRPELASLHYAAAREHAPLPRAVGAR